MGEDMYKCALRPGRPDRPSLRPSHPIFFSGANLNSCPLPHGRWHTPRITQGPIPNTPAPEPPSSNPRHKRALTLNPNSSLHHNYEKLHPNGNAVFYFVPSQPSDVRVRVSISNRILQRKSFDQNSDKIPDFCQYFELYV